MALDRLGLLDALEGIDAVPVHGYMVIHATEGTAPIPYPVNGSLDEIDGTTRKRQIRSPALADSWNSTPQYQGRSFHHGRFVGSLRRRMQGQDNLDVLEATVNDLVECESMGSRILGVKVTATEEDGSKRQFEILAPLTIIADGHASKCRHARLEVAALADVCLSQSGNSSILTSRLLSPARTSSASNWMTVSCPTRTTDTYYCPTLAHCLPHHAPLLPQSQIHQQQLPLALSSSTHYVQKQPEC